VRLAVIANDVKQRRSPNLASHNDGFVALPVTAPLRSQLGELFVGEQSFG